MKVVYSIEDLRKTVQTWRKSGETIALIPTMGALHDGHLSLVSIGRSYCQRTIVTIFVNPTQFGENEDLATYPSDFLQDKKILEKANVDLLFAPSVKEIYPSDFATQISVKGLSQEMCGAIRPGHFEGVATVVTKLFLQALPDTAIFGEKDFQQLQVIRRLTADLNIPVKIISGPTVRDADGLALSSRNSYLSESELKIAPVLYSTLKSAAQAIKANDSNIEHICEGALQSLLTAGFLSVDYFDVRDENTMMTVTKIKGAERIFCAAHLKGARLIDNFKL